MKSDDLSQYGIPTTDKTNATAFLRANPAVAHTFASVFGFDDADDRIALRAAQMAVVALFEGVTDVVGIVGPKLEGYRKYIANQPAPVVAPVTVTTVEVEAAAPEVEAAAPEVEAAAPEVEAAAPEVEAAAPEVEAAAPEVEAAAPDTTTGKRGRKKYSTVGKLTGYERCLKWCADNGVTEAGNRSDLATKILADTGIRVGSCLVYISLAVKAGVLK